MPPVRPNLAFSAAWRATIDEPSPAAGADRARFAARSARELRARELVSTSKVVDHNGGAAQPAPLASQRRNIKRRADLADVRDAAEMGWKAVRSSGRPRARPRSRGRTSGRPTFGRLL